MLEPHERFAIFRLIRSDRATNRETLQMAALYAGQVVLASVLLMEAYRFFNLPAALWAVVSAVLVIQPAMEQAIAASAVRIVANIVGGISGIVVANLLGNGIWQFLLALTIVVFICEFLRLDLGLRTACVSVAIIMIKGEDRVLSTGVERLTAVIIGCVTALLIQLLAEAIRKKLGWHGPDMSAIMPKQPAPIAPMLKQVPKKRKIARNSGSPISFSRIARDEHYFQQNPSRDDPSQCPEKLFQKKPQILEKHHQNLHLLDP